MLASIIGIALITIGSIAGLILLGLIILTHWAVYRMRKANAAHAHFEFTHLFGRRFVLDVSEQTEFRPVDVQLHLWTK